MTPLVLVHGFMGGSAQWGAQAALGSTRPLIAVDLPGFGRNAHLGPIDRIEGFAAFVLDTLHSRGVDRFHLLGHSMGGMVVQEMVRLAPERVDRLILYATAAQGALPGRFETIETSMARARADGARRTARRIAATWFRDREAAPAYAECAAVAELSGLDAILAGLEAMRAWSGCAHLPHIGAPTLIVWGDEDRTYAWPQIETLWSAIATSSLAVVPACAHAVHMEEPALFNPLVDRFLAHVSLDLDQIEREKHARP